jgi:Acetyltransferases, including N-acetylases of ribosomal proteins
MAALLIGESVALNNLRDDDVDAVYSICQDPEIHRWIALPAPYDRRTAEYFVNTYVPAGRATGRHMVWAIRHTEDGPLEGVVELSTAPQSVADIGYWLAPSARGHGLMTRSIGMVLDHAFRSIRLARVQWSTPVGNVGSARVARAAGFRFEGVARSAVTIRGIRRDAWRAAILSEDVREAQSGWPVEIG